MKPSRNKLRQKKIGMMRSLVTLKLKGEILPKEETTIINRDLKLILMIPKMLRSSKTLLLSILRVLNSTALTIMLAAHLGAGTILTTIPL